MRQQRRRGCLSLSSLIPSFNSISSLDLIFRLMPLLPSCCSEIPYPGQACCNSSSNIHNIHSSVSKIKQRKRGQNTVVVESASPWYRGQGLRLSYGHLPLTSSCHPWLRVRQALLFSKTPLRSSSSLMNARRQPLSRHLIFTRQGSC